MDEFMFVMKSLLVTVILLFCLQIKINNVTAETHALEWIEGSSVTRYLQNVAGGAVLGIRNLGRSVSQYMNSTFQGKDHQRETNRASRLSFEFKRSPEALGKRSPKPESDDQE